MKSFAKINIFLKIVGFRGNYHEIISRFVLFEDLFDEISFIKRQNEELILGDMFEKNIIKTAKIALENIGFKPQMDAFFKDYQIKLTKNIPSGAGLGGGSSNAATFLELINETLNLKISMPNLMKIGEKIGADVPFFISKLKSANVSGIGEIIENFDDEVPNLGLIFSQISCQTPLVFSRFRQDFIKNSQNFQTKFAQNLTNLKTAEILENFKNYELNDLLKPCLALYPQILVNNSEFLSGSGGTKFCVMG